MPRRPSIDPIHVAAVVADALKQATGPIVAELAALDARVRALEPEKRGPMDLYVYPTPLEAAVTLYLDSGQVVSGIRGVYKGRDGVALALPASCTATIGAQLQIAAIGKVTFAQRGMLIPGSSEAFFALDDVALLDAPPDAPPVPVYPTGTPEEIIGAIFAEADHDLSTKAGCGTFTEECGEALHASDPLWGHIKKDPGQNQFNGHAVDALMLLAGPGCGVFDIIHDSESANASPSYNYKGPPDPARWYFPA